LKATVSEPQSWKKVISIEVPDQEIQAEFIEKLKKFRREMKLPGFRQGKVPETLIKQRFGESIRAEIIDKLIQDSFKKACEEHKIHPVSNPKVVNLKADEGTPFVFTIETEVDPVIDISGYQNLKIKIAPKKIKDGDVDTAFQNLVERYATFTDVDRAVKKGDYIKLEYLKVLIDGEERTDIKNPTYPVEVGGENGLKEFYKGVVGHNAGETVDCTIKFPKDYTESNIAGKTGEFSIKIVSVQEKVLPEVNEDFLKKVGNFADEAALRENIRIDMENEERKREKEEAYNKAIAILIEKNEFEVPPARIDQFIEYMHQEALKYNRQGSALPLREDIAEQYHETAIASIKRHRIIDAIAEKEHIAPIQAEVDEEIGRIATMYQQDFETLKQILRKNGTTLRIRDEIRERKTLDYLIGEYTPEKSTE
jgi:trigger factor